MTLLEITLWSFVAAVAIGAMIAHWKWSNLKNAFSALADTRDGYKHRWKNAADGWREAEIARQMVRAEAALTDALDHRVTWSTCPVCGRLVACTGWPWSACRHCNYIIAKPEVSPADPIKVEADHLAAAARLYQAGKQLHDIITNRPRVCIEQTQGEARLGRALDAAIEHWPDITGKDPRDRDPDGMPRSTGATSNPDQTPPALTLREYLAANYISSRAKRIIDELLQEGWSIAELAAMANTLDPPTRHKTDPTTRIVAGGNTDPAAIDGE